ncbi:Gfo/Idh/MocA family oxidoreductase [Sphingomonas sp. LB-2]|uniref:Gfo/Idh/MocA family protein n=1 Tax=Sphingomonas caeni TaxID=2984949 RepID=UPI0022327835|nr:Gfo/Idh/MocA family oxidoreductase [Sphingomonas caeni]MCW3846887.1 Gfo/Idh/MocA family oxidoreductase [Sphingomonas caeni]
MASPFDIAIIGFGKIARDQHVPAILGSERFALAATVDSHGPGLDGVPHFRSLQALLESGVKADAVAVCTPPQVRGQIARQAIAAGLAVLLEKPPAETPGGFAALKALAGRAGVPLFTAWHSRFAAMVGEAKAWLAGKTVIAGRISWRESARKWHPGQRWLWEAGGLGVFDPGINALSILTELLPDPVVVTSSAFEVPSNCATPIAATMTLESGDAVIAVDLNFLEEHGEVWELELTTDGGTLLLSRGGAALSIDGAPAKTALDTEYATLYAHFADLLDRGESDADPAPLGLVADAFLIAEISPAEPYHD